MREYPRLFFLSGISVWTARLRTVIHPPHSARANYLPASTVRPRGPSRHGPRACPTYYAMRKAAGKTVIGDIMPI